MAWALGVWRWVQGLALASLLAARGVRKKSLSRSGAVAAIVVASVTWRSGPRFGWTLICFYQAGSWVTKVGAATKLRQDATARQGGQRGAAQVLSCSLVATCLAARHALACRPSEGAACDALVHAFVAFFACCAGDTFASELGALSTAPPRLVTAPWRRVPPGTNGGVSPLGTLASALGGLLIGLAHGLAGFFLPPAGDDDLALLAALGLVAGLVGSLLDSLLGALFQRTTYDDDRHCIADHGRLVSGRDWLSNHGVNFLSAALTAALGPPIALALQRLLTTALL